MTNETGGNKANDGENETDIDQKIDVKQKDTPTTVDKDTTESLETKDSRNKDNKRTVSFNRDVHVKRFGKPRESRGASVEQTSLRKEPFTNLSEQELIDEANKVLAQAQSVTCTADHPPDKFFSLPHRKKLKEDSKRRNSDDTTPERKTPLGRSTSDVSSKKRKERTSLSTLFRRAQKNKSPASPTKVVTVKRSKSDVSDLKSNTKSQSRPVRKRSGSETEEFLKSLRNKKTQLSPIIESSPREDYFAKTPPLEVFQKQKLSTKVSNKSDEKVNDNETNINPLVKPPRYKSPEKEPKPPARNKRGKSAEKEKEPSPSIADTPKRKTDVKKTLLVDEIDSFKTSSKDKIKDTIKKIEEQIYADKDMIHSSQQPPDKPPLTRGQTVDQMIKILKEDQMSPTPRKHLISPTNGTQPFSYLKPSVSPDGGYPRNSIDRGTPTPNKMTDKGVVYAQVIKDDRNNMGAKEPAHKTYSNASNKFTNQSDEDEGLGYEDRYKYANNRYDEEYQKRENVNFHDGYKITDSPIKPRFREYKLTSFEEMEPTYANEYLSKSKSPDYIEQFRGRADGMDTMKKSYEQEPTKVDLDFNELSHRRELLESRFNSRRFDRDRVVDEPAIRYVTETDPIYEAEKRMKATERYVNETARYYRHTLEKNGYADSNVTEEYSKYDSDNQKIKYSNEARTFQKVPLGEIGRRDFVDSLDFPPEPEYEPPSLESNVPKPVMDFKEKKFRMKKHVTSSHDTLQTGNKYKRDGYFGQRKGHYSSNPEIAQERDQEYANLPKYTGSYHNSLNRPKSKNKIRQNYVSRHDSNGSRDYYDLSPSRIDNRLVDSGIENDFRKDSSGEIHRRHRNYESDDDVRNTSSMFLDSERRHTEDNYHGEQIYANTEHLKYKYQDNGYPRDRSAEDGSRYERHDKSPSRIDEKISAKPPKAKKLSGLEKVKQLFSRDSSKKSKKEKEVVQPQTRTRVLKSPEHLARNDSGYRRYTDPEPSDIVVKKINYECLGDEKRIRSSREDLDRYRNIEPRDSDVERKYREHDDRYRSPDIRNGDPERKHRDYEERYTNVVIKRDSDDRRHLDYDDKFRSPEIRDSDLERKHRDYEERYERKFKEEQRNMYEEYRDDKRRYHSSDRESERPSDGEERKTRSRTRPMDSPALAERYRERRRLATPSPTPSPPRRQPSALSGSWFKSLDRLTRKKSKGKPVNKIEKESVITEDEASRKAWSKTKPPLNSPAKNLRFFGDTDQDSNVSHSTITKSKSHPVQKTHGTLRKTISNSTTGVDEVDHSVLSNKSYSLTNLHREEKDHHTRQYKRNLQNISENHSNSETESQFDRKINKKPPISPYDRSRSQSSSKTLKGDRRTVERGSVNDVRRADRSFDNRRPNDRGSSSDVRRTNDRGSSSDVRRPNDRGSSSDVRRPNGSLSDVRRPNERGSSTELRNGKPDLKSRRRTPATNSGESSTEGDSSHQSQRSVVYLHATTVGDIPDPGRISRNRSRDDVSSVNSSNLQVRSTTKSFSIFAPWTPKHYSEQQDVHYAQKPRKNKKEMQKAGSTRTLNNEKATLSKNKSYSQSSLSRRPASSRLSSSSTTLYRNPDKKSETHSTLRKSVSKDPKRTQSSEIITRDKERERQRENKSSSYANVHRSMSIPKDGKKASWFKITTNKNKKPEVNSRVR